MQARYSRQIRFSPIGLTGQQALATKHVLIIGAGALGTGNAEALARAGVGSITIVDRDYVEWSNLQRQQLYTEADAVNQIPKAIAAKRYLEKVNSQISIHAHVLDAGPKELDQLISEEVDLILDATDNFPTRMLLNDLSQKHRIPWIYGSCVGSYGISFTIIPGGTPCLHCLLERMPLQGPTCDTAGIISPTVSMVTAYQIAEALKVLTDNMQALRERLVCFDLWKNEHTQVQVSSLKKATCPSCGEAPTYPFIQQTKQIKTAILCGRDTVQIRSNKLVEVNIQQLADHFAELGFQTASNPFLLSVRLNGKRCVLFKDGRTLIHSMKDINEAERLYQQYIWPYMQTPAFL